MFISIGELSAEAVRRVGVIAALADLGFGQEPGVTADWREAYLTADLEAALAAREDDDFETVDQTIAGANAELAGWH